MGWNRSSESGGANTPGSPHVGQPKFALRSKGDGTAHGKSPRPRWLRGAVAALIVVVGAGIAAWWLLSPSPKRQTSNVKRQTPKPSLIADANSSERQKPIESPATNEAPKVQYREYVHNGIRSSNRPPADTNNMVRASQLEAKVVGTDGVARVVRVESPFKTPVNRMVWAAIRPGGMPSGLRALRSRMMFQTGSDEAFMQALKSQDITIDPGDSREVKDMKMRTAAMKAEFVEALESGTDFNEAIRQIEDVVRTERLTQRVSEMELRTLIKEGNPEAVRKYVELQNEILREKGLRELKMPSFADENRNPSN